MPLSVVVDNEQERRDCCVELLRAIIAEVETGAISPCDIAVTALQQLADGRALYRRWTTAHISMELLMFEIAAFNTKRELMG